MIALAAIYAQEVRSFDAATMLLVAVVKSAAIGALHSATSGRLATRCSVLTLRY